MRRQAVFLAALVGLVGCHIGEDKAGTKFQAGGGGENQPEIETFYVATVAAGKLDNGETIDGSQTIFLTKIDFNYATGIVTVKLKTVDKHGNLRSQCDELNMNTNELDGYGSVLPDDSFLSIGMKYIDDPENGSQIRLDVWGNTEFRGENLLYSIVTADKRVSEGMAQSVIGGELATMRTELHKQSHVKGGSEIYKNYMESIQRVNPAQSEGYHASTGLLNDSDFEKAHKTPLSSENIDLLDEKFWQNAFSNCSSGSPSDNPTGTP